MRLKLSKMIRESLSKEASRLALIGAGLLAFFAHQSDNGYYMIASSIWWIVWQVVAIGLLASGEE